MPFQPCIPRKTMCQAGEDTNCRSASGRTLQKQQDFSFDKKKQTPSRCQTEPQSVDHVVDRSAYDDNDAYLPTKWHRLDEQHFLKCSMRAALRGHI
mmetsp:Transcript_26220/g.31719  ORF Transcript_26220/g.31719 Transcript_26220/m.31719 type:complete len:96 (+) Transcript_26220:387-674(+)